MKKISVLFQVTGASRHRVLAILVEHQGKRDGPGDAEVVPRLQISLIDPRHGHKTISREELSKRLGANHRDSVSIGENLKFTGAALVLLNVIINRLLLHRIQLFDFL